MEERKTEPTCKKQYSEYVEWGDTHIELYDPEQGDEEEVESDEEAEGPPDVGDGLLLASLVGLDSGREGAGVDGGQAP